MKIKFAWSILFLVLLLAACTNNEEFKKTSGGFEYRVVNSTNGDKPQPGDFVYFHGYAMNGDSLVNSSRATNSTPFVQIPKPENADPNRKPGPVEEVAALLSMGDSAVIRIPMDSFPQRMPGFETADYMYYYIAPYKIKTEEAFMAEQQAEQEAERAKMGEVIAREPAAMAFAKQVRQDYLSKKLTGIQTTASGLKYIIHEPGTGPKAQPSQVVSVHYIGMLTDDGEPFDQSFSRGEPIQFPVGAGQVIPGWDEGLLLLNEGAKASFFIPAPLAYGAEGRPGAIPPNSELIFYVELEKVQ